MFLGTVTSRSSDSAWPARSPDLSVPDHFLWGHVTVKPRTLEELEEHIRDVIELLIQVCYKGLRLISGHDYRNVLCTLNGMLLLIKVKVKFTLEQGTKALRGSRGVTLIFLEPLRYLGVSGQRHAPAALPPGKRAGTHCIGG